MTFHSFKTGMDELHRASRADETAFYVFPYIENAFPHFYRTSTMVKITVWNNLDTQTGVNMPHAISTVLKTALYIFPDTQTGLHELHRTSKLVETAFNVPTDTQTSMNELC